MEEGKMYNAIILELKPLAILPAYSTAFIEYSDPSKGTSIFLNLVLSYNNNSLIINQYISI